MKKVATDLGAERGRNKRRSGAGHQRGRKIPIPSVVQGLHQLHVFLNARVRHLCLDYLLLEGNRRSHAFTVLKHLAAYTRTNSFLIRTRMRDGQLPPATDREQAKAKANFARFGRLAHRPLWAARTSDYKKQTEKRRSIKHEPIELLALGAL
jgi:hypothetical protein